jgi:(R,R)-butanediol dehydrogenase / meso-butanediol dehydrogenase / diacetyl reductase
MCGTDVHAFQAPDMRPPPVFGHEWTGTAAAIGDGVDAAIVGERVAVAVGPLRTLLDVPLGASRPLRHRVRRGKRRHAGCAPPHGGFATHVTVSQRRVVKLLDGLSDEQAAVIEPTAVTFHAVRRTDIALGSVVVVQGAGPIGLLTAQHARWAGAGRSLIVEPVVSRRDAAQELGFTDVFEAGDAFADIVPTATDGRGADVLFECTGVAKILQPSAELVRRGGTLSLVGYTTELSQVSYGDRVARELRVVGSLAYADEDFLGAMQSLRDASGQGPAHRHECVGLDGLSDVLTDLGSGSTMQAKVLIDPWADQRATT